MTNDGKTLAEEARDRIEAILMTLFPVQMLKPADVRDIMRHLAPAIERALNAAEERGAEPMKKHAVMLELELAVARDGERRALEEVEQLKARVASLVEVGSGANPHIDEHGCCPGDLSYDVRNQDCPACRILVAAEGGR